MLDSFMNPHAYYTLTYAYNKIYKMLVITNLQEFNSKTLSDS